MSLPAGALTVSIWVDGQILLVAPGQFLGAILHADRGGFRRTKRENRPRGLFCGIGICFDCLVTVDGKAEVRACITPVRDGMRVETGRS